MIPLVGKVGALGEDLLGQAQIKVRSLQFGTLVLSRNTYVTRSYFPARS